MNVIYLISCTNCNEQYVGSAIDFKNFSEYIKLIFTGEILNGKLHFLCSV